MKRYYNVTILSFHRQMKHRYFDSFNGAKAFGISEYLTGNTPSVLIDLVNIDGGLYVSRTTIWRIVRKEK